MLPHLTGGSLSPEHAETGHRTGGRIYPGKILTKREKTVIYILSV